MSKLCIKDLIRFLRGLELAFGSLFKWHQFNAVASRESVFPQGFGNVRHTQ